MLHSFMGSPTDGSYPVGGVTIGTGGVLYGTTNSGGTDQVGPGCSATVGGSSCQGTIFSLAPPAAPTDAWTETLLYSVGEGAFADGFGYEAGVLIGKNGVLYGVAPTGGIYPTLRCGRGCASVLSCHWQLHGTSNTGALNVWRNAYFPGWK